MRKYPIKARQRDRKRTFKLRRLSKQHRSRFTTRKRPYSAWMQPDKDIIRRKNRRSHVFARVPFKDSPQKITVSGDVGLEDESKTADFFNIAGQLITSRSKYLEIDLEGCTRVWPSFVTMLCSLNQWVEHRAQNSTPPRVASTSPRDSKVESYLSHCGFYTYVQRTHAAVEGQNHYNDREVVKIVREEKRASDEKEDQVWDLIREFGIWDDDETEVFVDKVLLEIFCNVTEHGRGFRDKGWWALCQYHPTHKFISLCIADNGIGIRNSLATGPQRNELLSMFSDDPCNDGEYIKLAFRENTSGALTAPIKEKRRFRRDKHLRGARKGNGLKRIHDSCAKLGARLSVLSHHGYLLFDENGEVAQCGSSSNMVFAGTMYNVIIPAKSEARQ